MKNKKVNRRFFFKKTTLSFIATSIFSNKLFSSSKSLIFNKEKNNCPKSTEDLYGQGPFYTTNSPMIQNNQLASSNEVGQRIIISGRVYNLDCDEFLPNTEIDIWHANNEGEYDNVGFNLRGRTLTNSQGFYIFETVKPGFYLNGNTNRPSHIHFKITPPGFPPLITQLYFQSDPYISSDAAASVTSGTFDATNRIIPLVQNSNGILEGNWDIVINGAGTTVDTKNLYLDKGILYRANPNPFINFLEINYAIFKSSDVKIQIFDLEGKLVELLQQKKLQPNKYKLIWNPKNNIKSGHYFICLSINDLQVHYIKVIKN